MPPTAPLRPDAARLEFGRDRPEGEAAPEEVADDREGGRLGRVRLEPPPVLGEPHAEGDRAGPLAARVRAHAEVLRATPRHGTRRRLSALSIGILALSLGRFVALARQELHGLLAAFARGVPAVEITR